MTDLRDLRPQTLTNFPNGITSFGRVVRSTETTPENFQAVPGGAVDCRAALLEALQTGDVVDGRGQTFGVSGRLDLPANARLYDITLKQLAADASQSVITLYASGVNNLDLRGVRVDKNGTGENDGNNAVPNGAQATCFGMKFTGGTGHHFEDLEVYGDDSCTGIGFHDLDGTSTINGAYVHDMIGVVPSATDDVMQGILFNNCDGMHFKGLRVARIGWKDDISDPDPVPGVATDWQNSRCIPVTGTTNCHFDTIRCEDAMQGFDSSGDVNDGNMDNRVTNGYVKSIANWGYKLAVLTKRTHLIDCVAEYCTFAGFVDSTSYATAGSDLDANWIVRCTALDCGESAGTKAGFLQLNGESVSRPYSNFSWFVDCKAKERRTGAFKMYNGFYNEKPLRANAQPRLINCNSEGHTLAAFTGFSNPTLFYQNVASYNPTGDFNVDTYYIYSKILIRHTEYTPGTKVTWRFHLRKTAAGTATGIIKIRIGTAGAIGDTAISTVTLPAQTAAVDECDILIEGVIRYVDPNTFFTGKLVLTHKLAATGFINAASHIEQINVSGAASVAGGGPYYLGISMNGGASAAWTGLGCTAEIEYPNQR